MFTNIFYEKGYKINFLIVILERELQTMKRTNYRIKQGLNYSTVKLCPLTSIYKVDLEVLKRKGWKQKEYMNL